MTEREGEDFDLGRGVKQGHLLSPKFARNPVQEVEMGKKIWAHNRQTENDAPGICRRYSNGSEIVNKCLKN
ncbi:hypothetical protein C0J52_22764 [Blattella germanica]|nr:hypothetical protein C0J52_22764 [Blattella germanica]